MKKDQGAWSTTAPWQEPPCALPSLRGYDQTPWCVRLTHRANVLQAPVPPSSTAKALPLEAQRGSSEVAFNARCFNQAREGSDSLSLNRLGGQGDEVDEVDEKKKGAASPRLPRVLVNTNPTRFNVLYLACLNRQQRVLSCSKEIVMRTSPSTHIAIQLTVN